MKKTSVNIFIMACMAVSIVSAAEGKVRFAPPFGDGMVLQRGMPVAVWGRAPAGEEVSVSFAGNTVKAVADAKGAWKCRLPAMEASAESRTLAVTGKGGSHAVRDVLVGEVWLMGGQSNAECPFWQEKGVRYRDVKGGMMAQFYRMPQVRFTAAPGVWRECVPSNLVDVTLDATKRSTSFSAIGVYFAAQLHQVIGVPVGMIGEYVRGSGIDTWIPREGYVMQGGFEDMLEWKRIPQKEWTKACIKYPIVRCGEQPSTYWEGRMARWTPYTFRGALWHQGCSNAEDPRYCEKLHALYSGWSRLFENPGMSFYLVEIGRGDGSFFNLQRLQARFADEEPNAALAPANDVGNPKDGHGNDKETMARRLLLHALRRNYGFEDVRNEPPVVKSAKAEGGRAVLKVGHARTLYVYNASAKDLKTSFELAGEDGVWHHAEIENFTKTAWSMEGYIAAAEIVLKAKGVDRPRRARYLHEKDSRTNVYNDVCLPLLAFEVEVAD